MKRVIICIVMVAFYLPSFSQDNKEFTVEGDTTYVAPKNLTREMAEQKTLQLARIKALEKKFGIYVDMLNILDIINYDEKSHIGAVSISESDVKGEWLETIEENVEQMPDFDGLWVFRAHVKGRAREIVSSGIDLTAKILRNGTDESDESNVFLHNNRMYLLFRTPVDGFLAIYIVDDKNKVNCLLPYDEQKNGIYNVSANHDHYFYNGNKRLTTMIDSDWGVWYVYFIFSPNPFTKAVDVAPKDSSSKDPSSSKRTILPRQLENEDFQRWLSRCRREDTKLTYIKKPLIIKKKM